MRHQLHGQFFELGAHRVDLLGDDAAEPSGHGRADELPPDALMYAVALAGKAGDNGDSVLRGFLQRITAEVAQP